MLFSFGPRWELLNKKIVVFSFYLIYRFQNVISFSFEFDLNLIPKFQNVIILLLRFKFSFNLVPRFQNLHTFNFNLIHRIQVFNNYDVKLNLIVMKKNDEIKLNLLIDSNTKYWKWVFIARWRLKVLILKPKNQIETKIKS